MLLVSFSFGVIVSGYRYLKSRNPVWAFFTGVFLGLMHATKETSILVIGAMILALYLTMTLRNRENQKPIVENDLAAYWRIGYSCLVNDNVRQSYTVHI